MITANRKERIKLIIKWIVFAFLILIGFVISTTGNNYYAEPLLLLPIAVCISIDENELVSGIVGGICGLLIDISCGKLVGFNAILILVCSVLTCLCFKHLMRKNIFNAMLLTAGVAIIQAFFDIFFFYIVWNVPKTSVLVLHMTIPSIVFTVISSAIVYLVFKKLTAIFAGKETIVLEDNRYTADKKQ